MIKILDNDRHSKELKTSEEWYKGDLNYDLKSPDGWRRANSVESQSCFWYNVKISREKYNTMINTSSLVPYNTYNHRSPYFSVISK